MNKAKATRAADRRTSRAKPAVISGAMLLLAFQTTASLSMAEPSSLPPEVGYNYADTDTPHSGALGGAHRALSSSIDALFLNPANMAVSRVYHLAALAQILPQARRQSYGGAIVDSLVNRGGLAGGFGGTYNVQDPDGLDRHFTELRFALAYPFSDSFFLGLGGRYLRLSENGSGPLGTSPVSGGLFEESIVDGFGLDAGLTVKPTPELALSAVGNYLNDPDTGFQPTTFGGGVGYGSELFGIEADLIADVTTWNETTLRAMGGAELLLGDHFPLRIGYRYDEGLTSHALSGGVGYTDEVFSVDFGLRGVVSGPAVTTVLLGFAYHLDSSGLAPDQSDTF